MQKIKTLIIDDSKTVRKVLTELLIDENDIEIIGTASDPFIAVEIMEKIRPDVIVLDIHMPRMDGLTFLQKIMNQHPIPVIICSSYAIKGSYEIKKALQYGAVKIILKPKVDNKVFWRESKIILCDAIRSAACAKLSHIFPKNNVQPKLSADVILDKSFPRIVPSAERLIVIGASAGGPQAIAHIMRKLPADLPGIVITQHMPEKFTEIFAKSLNDISKATVTEAKDGDIIKSGHVYVSPGNTHTLINNKKSGYCIKLKYGPLVSRHRPSVDVLFRSAAKCAGKNALGIILTGMGDDGSKGMAEMKEVNAFNIAQSKESCVVFGMPREAIKANAVDETMDLDEISSFLMRFRPNETKGKK